MRVRGVLIANVAASLLAFTTAAGAPSGIAIHTEDVDRFFRVYDAARGHPTAEQLQRDYIDAGSAGLHQLAKARNITGARIAQAIEQQPGLYTNARACMSALPRARARLDAAFVKLVQLYPEAQKPPVTIAVSRGKPVAISGPGEGVQVSLEAICGPIAARFMDADVDDRFVHVIAHEYIHAQQDKTLADDEHPTVLERSLLEGAADFMGEMISGGAPSSRMYADTKGREAEIETRFVADEDKTDLSAWVDNTTPEKFGELGYWVGYRICKAYYQHARDKRRAIREIIEMKDPHAFLAKSGWRPGIALT
jgi:hypothetical protein